MTQWMRPGEAARRLGVSPQTVANYVDAGRLGALVLPSGHRRVAAADVERLAHQLLPIPAPTSHPLEAGAGGPDARQDGLRSAPARCICGTALGEDACLQVDGSWTCPPCCATCAEMGRP